MSRTIVQTERIHWVTGKPFDAVLSGIYQGIGRPDITTLFGKLTTTTSFDEFSQLVNDAVGPSKLMQFLTPSRRWAEFRCLTMSLEAV
jgi:hypothetical protein